MGRGGHGGCGDDHERERFIGGTGADPCHKELERQKRPLYYAMLLTLFFTVIQICAAKMADSVALLADALHHLVDVAMIIGALLAVDLSQGAGSGSLYYDSSGKRHHKPELWSGIINSLVLLGLCAWIIVTAVERLNEYNDQEHDGHHRLLRFGFGFRWPG